MSEKPFIFDLKEIEENFGSGVREIAESYNSNALMQDLVLGVRYDEEMRRRNKMKLFKVDAQDDTMYFRANSLEHAKEKFENIMGDVPEYLLTWAEIEELPEGEEVL